MTKTKPIFIITLLVLCCGYLSATPPEPKPLLAVVDSARLLKTISAKFKVSALILSDYQIAIKLIPNVAGQEKATETEINQVLEEILAFYASQLIRPLMIEINRLVAEKRFVAIINKSDLRLEETLLQGEDARPNNNDKKRNPALEKLEKPFSSGVYCSEYQAIEITDVILSLVEEHLKTTPLMRFSLQSATQGD